MEIRFFALLLSAWLSGVSAYAAGSTASLGGSASGDAASSSASSAEGSGFDKKFHDDHTITDTVLRAREGSMSLFSLRGNFSYFGPTVDDFSRPDQPSPDGVVSRTAVGPSGSVGARYRFDPTTSVTANVGLTDQYLFTSKPSHLDANDPFVTYDKSFRIGPVQMIASPGATFITSNVYKRVGEVAGLNAGLYGSYNIAGSRFAVGSSTNVSYLFFKRDYVPDRFAAGGGRGHRGGGGFAGGPTLLAGDGRVRRISATVSPELKYNATDRLNVNTSIGFNFFNPRYYDDVAKFNSRIVNERLGVGYAVTKDIYLSPFLQFYPTQFTWNTTTVNFSTIISLL